MTSKVKVILVKISGVCWELLAWWISDPFSVFFNWKLGERVWRKNGKNGTKNRGPKSRNQGTHRKSENTHG